MAIDLEGNGLDGGEETRGGKAMALSKGNGFVELVLAVVLSEIEDHGPDLREIEVRLKLWVPG